MSVPHGGRLIDRLVACDAIADAHRQAQQLPALVISAREQNDLGLIANGALSPLRGFMTRDDYERVVTEMRLHNGLPWSIPVTLSVTRHDAPALGSRVALRDERGELLALLDVEDVFAFDREREAREVYGTQESAHPGVAALFERKDLLVGGTVHVVPTVSHPLSLSPMQTRAAFAQRGWKTIVGFQTRNPVHRAHEYIQKCALEAVDGLLLHPLVGETKSDDIAPEIRLRCYEILLEHYYPKDRVLLSTLPAAMRYAGPREAIFHALIRKNYGCTHFIVGRDHAGVGTYYGTYDAQRLFDAFAPGELGIIALKYENSFYCRRCEGMASRKTCAHDESAHVTLSGTAVRALLASGKLPPPEFSRPEVARVLVEALHKHTHAS